MLVDTHDIGACTSDWERPLIAARASSGQIELQRRTPRLRHVRAYLRWRCPWLRLVHGDVACLGIRAHADLQRSMGWRNRPTHKLAEQLSSAGPLHPGIRPPSAQVAGPGNCSTETVLPASEQRVGGVGNEQYVG